MAVLSGIGLIVFALTRYKDCVAVIIGIGGTAVVAFLLCYIPIFYRWEVLYPIFCIFIYSSIVVSAGVGVFLALFFTRVYLTGAKFLTGAVGGIVVAVLLNPLSFAYINYYLFLPVASACALGGGFLALKKSNLAYWWTLNLLASYLVLRGLSAFIGYFPSSIEFRREYTNSEITVTFYITLGFSYRSSNLFSISISSWSCWYIVSQEERR